MYVDILQPEAKFQIAMVSCLNPGTANLGTPNLPNLLCLLVQWVR